jgi:ComF family protein
LKYKFVEDLAEPLGGLIVKNIREMGSRPGKEFIIIGIPLFRKRLIERGFNQAVLLAKIVSRDLGWPMEEKALQRVRATVPQVELEEEGRAQNIKNAFAVFDSSKIINKKIILVDDVLTTGATMEECAKTLKLSGAKEVWGVALAKG